MDNYGMEKSIRLILLGFLSCSTICLFTITILKNHFYPHKTYAERNRWFFYEHDPLIY